MTAQAYTLPDENTKGTYTRVYPSKKGRCSTLKGSMPRVPSIEDFSTYTYETSARQPEEELSLLIYHPADRRVYDGFPSQHVIKLTTPADQFTRHLNSDGKELQNIIQAIPLLSKKDELDLRKMLSPGAKLLQYGQLPFGLHYFVTTDNQVFMGKAGELKPVPVIEAVQNRCLNSERVLSTSNGYQFHLTPERDRHSSATVYKKVWSIWIPVPQLAQERLLTNHCAEE